MSKTPLDRISFEDALRAYEERIQLVTREVHEAKYMILGHSALLLFMISKIDLKIGEKIEYPFVLIFLLPLAIGLISSICIYYFERKHERRVRVSKYATYFEKDCFSDEVEQAQILKSIDTEMFGKYDKRSSTARKISVVCFTIALLGIAVFIFFINLEG